MRKLLLAQFNLHHRLYNNVLEDFADEETNRRLCGDRNINHVKYIAGHLLNAQYGLAALAGIPMEPRWEELFAPLGQSKARDDFKYPGIQEVKAEWNRIYDPVRTGFENLTAADLKRTPPRPLDKVFENDAIFENTVADFWAFLNHHQAYHIGQIGILRRGFAKAPMRYS